MGGCHSCCPFHPHDSGILSVLVDTHRSSTLQSPVLQKKANPWKVASHGLSWSLWPSSVLPMQVRYVCMAGDFQTASPAPRKGSSGFYTRLPMVAGCWLRGSQCCRKGLRVYTGLLQIPGLGWTQRGEETEFQPRFTQSLRRHDAPGIPCGSAWSR